MPSDYVTLPSSTIFFSESTSIASIVDPIIDDREVELQSTCLDVHALFGLFIVISIWVVCDLLIKAFMITRQLYRRMRKASRRQYPIEQASEHNSTISEDYVTGQTSIPMRPNTSTPRPLRAGKVKNRRRSIFFRWFRLQLQ